LKKTILITSNTSWYLFNFRKNTILRFIAEGYSIVCCAPLDAYSEKLSALGATFVNLKVDGKSIGVLQELMSFLTIFSVLRQNRPVMVFNFTIKMNLYFGLWCRVLRIPYANNVSGLGTVFLHESWTHSLAKWLYGIANKGARTVFFQNTEDRQLFLDNGLVSASRAVLLPGSGVDTERFQYLPMPVDCEPVVLMVGRLIGDKGVREFASAAVLLRSRGSTARFLLVGAQGVSNRTAITEAEIAQWKSDGVLDYVGETDDVIPFLQQCHVLVLPSYREGMPRVVLEAASVGRPALVTDVPGCRQSVEVGKTGWLCEVANAESLAITLAHVLEMSIEELEEFGVRARKRVVAEFSESIVIEAYVNSLPDLGR